jgi:hypothetical protein
MATQNEMVLAHRPDDPKTISWVDTHALSVELKDGTWKLIHADIELALMIKLKAYNSGKCKVSVDAKEPYNFLITRISNIKYID